MKTRLNLVLTNVIMVFCTVFTSVLISCETEQINLIPDTIVGGYQAESSLTHAWDSLYKVRVTDNMVSNLTIWQIQDGSKVEPAIYSDNVHPVMEAHSILSREDYAITENQVNIAPTSSTIIREQKTADDGSLTEQDTVRFWFEDGQIKSIPVTITNKQVVIDNNVVFNFPSLTLVKAEFAHLINNPLTGMTRAAKTYVSAEYTTEYKTWLTLQETNIENPQTFVVPVYAYTTRRVLSDNNIKQIVINNKNRVWIDTETERCSFDIVTVYASGEQTKENKEIILKHKFAGIEPYDKFVSSFDYFFKDSNGVESGSETARESGIENWSVWGKTDKYGANVENGTAADKIATVYNLYHERAVYQKDTLTVSFPFITPDVQEIQTAVESAQSDKTGYKKAVLKNFIGTTYLGGTQRLDELVNLYMRSNDIIGYDIINPSIKVVKDSVIADLDFVTKYADGTETKSHDHFSALRTLKCNTDWESIQEILSQVTDTTCVVTISNSEGKTKGYWRYNNETRNITNYAHLYNGESKLNGWTSVVPNKVSYVREGKSYTFEVLPYKITERGASLNLRGEENGYSVYDYTNLIEENFNGYIQSSSASGVIKIVSEAIKGYEIRNKLLTITPESVKADLDFVTIFSNGREDVEKVTKEFARSLVCTTDWRATEQNANEQTTQPSAQLTASQNKTENEWSWVEQTRSISATVTLDASTQYNGWTASDPNNIKYTRNGISVDFGTIRHTTAKVASNTTLKNTEGLTETYQYNNTIGVGYGDNIQNISAPGKITVNKQKTVVGYEITNQNMTVAQNGVTASLTFVTNWSDGSKDTDNVSRFFARSFNVLTNWSSNEDNANQNTSSANVTLKSSENKTDGDWSYVSETRSISTTAALNGSSQKNGWESNDPNNIVFSRNGKTYAFGALNFSATEKGANVSKDSENDEATVYSYTDNISVTFGSNTFSSTAPGKITVAALWNPDFDYGPFKSCVFTTAVDENRRTWVYVASVHFEQGTLPLIIRKEANSPEVNVAYFENNTDSRLNSATWLRSRSTWINTIAADYPDLMEWNTTSSHNADNLAYPTATAWGWDYGRTVSGHPSVTTDRFSAEISHNGYMLTIYKQGKVFAQYKAKK